MEMIQKSLTGMNMKITLLKEKTDGGKQAVNGLKEGVE
jgi:hypothetical protein